MRASTGEDRETASRAVYQAYADWCGTVQPINPKRARVPSGILLSRRPLAVSYGPLQVREQMRVGEWEVGEREVVGGDDGVGDVGVGEARDAVDGQVAPDGAAASGGSCRASARSCRRWRRSV
jgi:hypothetical protein